MTGRAAKVAHVLGQASDGRHTCHWPGCRRVVAPARWGCREHWFKLPKRLRDAVWSAYRPGQEISKTPSAGYVAVAREVQRWIEANAEPAEAPAQRGLFEEGGH